MKQFNICCRDNTNFFGVNLKVGNVFGCLEITTKHRNYKNKKVLWEKPRKVLYVIKDLKFRGNNDHTHVLGYYTILPETKCNPNQIDLKWQHGALQGSVLLESVNRRIMEYISKFYDSIELVQDKDKHIYNGDIPIKGLDGAIPRRKDHQQALVYKSSPKQCNPTVWDGDIAPRRPIVHGLHKTLTRDEHGNPINEVTIAHNRDLEEWKSQRRAKGLSTDESIFFKEHSLLVG
jgi:hypothetical protein